MAGAKSMRPHVVRSLTFRTLGKNRLRTAVTIAGIALATALLAAVLTTVHSMSGFLLEQEIAQKGAWQAEVSGVSESQIDAARTAEGIRSVSVVREIGSAALPAGDEARFGHYLTVKAIDADHDSVLPSSIAEGRLPEASDEIALHGIYRDSEAFSEKPLEIGSTITIGLGQRQVYAADDPEQAAIEGVPYLDASIGYVGADGGGAEQIAAYTQEKAAERLVGVQKRTYTVVGFMDRTTDETYASDGAVGLTYADDSAALAVPGLEGGVHVFVATSGLSTEDALVSCVERAFGVDSLSLHASLLRYQGIVSDRSIWDTVYLLAAVLALVIAAASASLIYNSFAISVAERTRQFGLLSSVGASRRQLRRMVLLEACALAAVGIPLGIALGMAGAYAVLGSLAPAFTHMLGGMGDGAAFHVSFSAPSLAVAAALAFATVLVSAWLPSLRAARVSAVDAVRNTPNIAAPGKQGRHAAGKGVAATAASAGPGAGPGAGAGANVTPSPKATRESAARAWSPRGFSLSFRLFGAAGLLAKRNAKRQRGKGRAAALSLCMSVVLLVTAGSFSMYLGTGLRAVDAERPSHDILAYAFPEEATAGTAGRLHEALAAAAPEAQSAGFGLVDSMVPATLSANMGSRALVDFAKAGEDDQFTGGLAAAENDDGAIDTEVTLAYVDDDAFTAFAKENGLDAQSYLEAARAAARGEGEPWGIGVRTIARGGGETYEICEPFANTGTISVWEYPQTSEGQMFSVERVLSDGSLGKELITSEGADGDTSAQAGGSTHAGEQSTQEKPRRSVAEQTGSVEVKGFADEAPDCVTAADSIPCVVLPLSALAADTVLGQASFYAAFDADDHIDVTAKMSEALAAALGASDISGTNGSVSDFAASFDSSALMVAALETLALCFSLILLLIAVANVFNTVANDLALRRREFAVLRSVGMGNKAFFQMMAWETMGRALRGLAAGLVLATLASYGIYRALELSITGMAFTLPWGYVVGAIAITVAAMLASTAFGLARAKSGNIVEALRRDGM